MPEGHLAHRYAELQRPLVGSVLAVSSPQGRFGAGAAAVDGRVLDDVQAYGKHLLHRFGDVSVHTHLGMQGVWAELPAPPPPPRPQCRLRLSAPSATWDLFAPSTCELLAADDVEALLGGLGPDPLRHDDPARALDLLAGDDRPVGVALLDQGVVAGVGNVLRAEALAAVGVHPTRPSSSLGRPVLQRLWDELVVLMRDAADRGEISKLVYKQERCGRCGAPIESFELPRGRIAYRCPACQREP